MHFGFQFFTLGYSLSIALGPPICFEPSSYIYIPEFMLRAHLGSNKKHRELFGDAIPCGVRLAA